MLLNYREYGTFDSSKPTLVLLHGLFGSSSNWGSIAKYLSQNFYILVPDLRNHGNSFHHDDGRLHAMMDDLTALFSAKEVTNVWAVGHSMGGKVAMGLALNYPDLIKRLAVVDMSPVTYRHDFDDVIAAFRSVDLDHVSNRQQASEQMSLSIEEPSVRAFLLQNLQKVDQKWSWRMNLDVLSRTSSTLVQFPEDWQSQCYTLPTSFIYGENSNYVLPEYHETIYRYFPNAALCRVENAGHWVYAENPQGFARCMSSFLS